MVKKILLLILFGIILVFALKLSLGNEEKICNGNYFLLELESSSGDFQLVNKSIQQGCAPDSKGDFEYSYDLVKNNVSVYSGNFGSGVLFVDNFEEQEMQGGAVAVDNQKIFLTIPYNSDADNIEISKQGEKIFEGKIYDSGSTSCKLK